jgi:hypothetical protein
MTETLKTSLRVVITDCDFGSFEIEESELQGFATLNHPRLKSGDLRSPAKADWGRHHGSTLKSAS